MDGWTQKVEANGLYITWRLVTSEELQGTVGDLSYLTSLSMRRWQSALVIFANDTKMVGRGGNRDALICLRAGSPSRGTKTGWRNGPTGALWNSIRSNTKSCTWDHLAVVQAEDTPAGEQLCWEGLEGHGRQQAEREPALCSSSKGGQQYPGLYWQQHGQYREGSDYHPLLSTT